MEAVLEAVYHSVCLQAWEIMWSVLFLWPQ